MTLNERSNITETLVDEQKIVMQELKTELDGLERQNAGTSTKFSENAGKSTRLSENAGTSTRLSEVDSCKNIPMSISATLSIWSKLQVDV